MYVASGHTVAVRLRILGGILGPAAFITAWAVLGARQEGYSPVDDPISRLAAVGSPSRAAMTAGLVGFAVGVGAFSTTLPRRPAVAAAVTAAASVGIALTPLDSSVGGAPHAAAAGIAYLSLAALPLLGSRTAAGRATGVLCGGLLLASVVAPGATGALQRAGLTVGDAWIVATALSRLRR